MEQGEAGGGILHSLRNLASTTVALLQTRLELLVTEVEEERVRLLQLALWAAGALFFLGLGILLLVILIVVLFWDSHRVAVLLALTAFFLGGGVALAIGVRNRMHRRSRLFAASLAELDRDRDQLTPR